MNASPPGPRIAFAAIVVAMLPAVLDQTMLATALPTISADLGKLADVSWIVTAYVVAAAASTPLWGKLGDRHGRKRLLELSLVLFVATSAVCGQAQDITALIVSRAMQGIAAGGLMTLANAAVGDLVSPRERGRYQGYIAAVFAIATVAGPLIGGLLVDHASWRWVFYVNLPLGVVAFAGLASRLPAGAPREGQRQPLDAIGAALLAAGTTALMLACVWGGQRYAWGSAPIVSLLAATVILAALLAVRTRRAADPIVPFELLRSRAVAVASAGLFLATAALFSINVFVPLFLQVTTGASPTGAGLLMIPMMIGITASTTLAGRSIQRTGRYKRFPVAGLALMTLALTALAIVTAHPSRVSVGICLAVFGFGFGMVGQVLIVAVQNGVDRSRLGTGMATTSFFRALGGALGAAVLGAVFAARAGSTGGGVAVHALSHAGRAEVISGVQTVFAIAAPVAALGLAVVLLLREVPLAGGPQAGAETDARTRSPRGSNSGSAATSPDTQRPKMSTSTSAPTSTSGGR
jgi:EmrB/QacA subfamily drug resistance transporter